MENIPSSSSLHQEKIVITVSLNIWTLFFVVNLIAYSMFQYKVIEMFSLSAHAQDINFATCKTVVLVCVLFFFNLNGHKIEMNVYQKAFTVGQCSLHA